MVNPNLPKTKYSGLYVNSIVLIKAFQKFYFIAFEQLSRNKVMYGPFTKLWQRQNVPVCRVLCFHVSRECVDKFNRHCGSDSGEGVVHVQALYGNSA